MKRHLFEDSFYDYRSAQTELGVRALEGLERSKYLDGSYQQKIEEIVNGSVFKVATLHPENRKGKRRVERRISSDCAQAREIDMSVIDVIIPFSGDQSSFLYSPLSRTDLRTQAIVFSDNLVITFCDNEALEESCNYFIGVVEETLSELLFEMSLYRSKIKQVLETFASQRMLEVKQHSDLDKGRSFQID